MQFDIIGSVSFHTTNMLIHTTSQSFYKQVISENNNNNTCIIWKAFFSSSCVNVNNYDMDHFYLKALELQSRLYHLLRYLKYLRSWSYNIFPIWWKYSHIKFCKISYNEYDSYIRIDLWNLKLKGSRDGMWSNSSHNFL